TQPTLLLTRPKMQSAEFLSDCEKRASRRLSVVISPILRIEPRANVPDLNPYPTLIFTSANGVSACADDLHGRRVLTVGAKTCELAIQAGALAHSLGEDVDAFVAHAGEIAGPVLHCRGAHARGDLASRLNAKGIKTDEAVLYDQFANPLTPAARNLLQDKNLVVVAPLFSPRSAQLLCENMIEAEMKIIAMSAAVANAWTGPGTIETVSAPTAAKMALQTVRHF
ncbi:unnamed protein product, partial [Ectocarpus sp. 12 AP-2014]